jgi:hypothetical protein
MRGKEKSDPNGLLYIPFCKENVAGFATTKRVSSCVPLHWVASLQGRKERGRVPRCVSLMGILNKYPLCGVTTRITLWILNVWTQWESSLCQHNKLMCADLRMGTVLSQLEHFYCLPCGWDCFHMFMTKHHMLICNILQLPLCRSFIASMEQLPRSMQMAKDWCLQVPLDQLSP